MTCCFIGHKNTDLSVFPYLLFAIGDLINKNGVDTFYVGHNGSFDRMAYNIIRSLKEEDDPSINLSVVLAYLPAPDETPHYDYTIYPEGLEFVPKRFAISKRNQWMIDNSDYVVCHVTNTVTNAHKFREYAKRKKKIIIDV